MWAAAVCVLLAACTATTPHGDRLRVARIENAVLPMATSALATGQIETARRLYQRLLEFDPESVDARMGLGDVALADREAAQAATWYLAAVAYADAPPQRQAALLAHGRAALAAGDLDAAGTSFGHLIDPRENASRAEVAWGYNGIGLVNLLAGNPREAVAALEQAVRRAPDEPRFQANLDRALRIVANYVTPETPSAEASAGTRTLTDTASPRGESDPTDVRNQEPQPALRLPLSRQEAPPPATVDASPARVTTTPGVASDDERLGVPAQRPIADEPPTEVSRDDVATVGEPSPSTQSPPDAPEEPEPTLPADIEPAVPIEILRVPPTIEPADIEPAVIEPADDAPSESTAGQPDPAVETPPTVQGPDEAPEEPPPLPRATGGVSAAFVVSTPTGDYLQVGAYAEEMRALDEASRLSDMTDLPMRIDEGDAAKPLFRVQIGPLPADGLPPVLADTLGVDIDRLRYVDRIPSQTRIEPGPPKQPPPSVQGNLASIVEGDPTYVVEDSLAYIEVGTFASYDVAAAAAADLEARALPVEVSTVSQGGAESLYRVRVGPLPPDSLPAHLTDPLSVDISRLRSVEPAATRAEPEPPEQLPSIVEDGLAYIEIGTFASHDTAAAAASDLEARALPVEVSKMSRGGAAPTYHVRVGPLAPDALAQTLKALQTP